MAKKQRKRSAAAAKPNSSVTDTRVFLKGMVKDANASFQAKQAWSHARNAANNSTDGDTGVVGNEPANLPCGNVPYTVIGAIHLYGDQWVLYSTDDINSEIGLFDDSKCAYSSIVNDSCLNFSTEHLIVGAAKENFDCTWQVYWDDGNNPSRTLNINDVPYIQIEVAGDSGPCVIYQDTNRLDCEKIRLAPLLDTPCVKVSKAESGGQLRNGSYQVFIAYTVNEQKVTDYIGVSNIQSLWDHDGTAGSLKIEVSNLDQEFEFYELVILSNNQANTVAKKIGLYSTEQTNIEIDYIDQSLVTVPLELIPLRSPAYEKSEAMYVVNDYLIRQGPTEQFDFNYQPLANQIKSRFVVAEYPSEYYYKGGNSVGFMRDEQYSFFIRWIYNTGERSSSYHIPGRAPRVSGVNQFGEVVNETALASGANTLSTDEMNFQVFNTAVCDQINLSIPTGDEGTIIAKGDMAYWESSEKYPATKPEIWGDLCGRYIRHHKMPTEEIAPQLHLSNDDNTKIRVLGVEFYNIKPPVDNNGNLITNIVGYELLRGSREGHRSILAKGIFRNMREYIIPDTGGKKGLYPNYPYNDLRADVYFHDGSKGYRTDGCDDFTNTRLNWPALTGYKKDFFTFHSPELMFRRPFLNAYETRVYGELSGESTGHFIKSEGHPQNKLIRNSGAILAGIIGVGYAINQVQGTREFAYNGSKLNPQLFTGSATGFPIYGGLLATLAGVGGGNALLDALIDVLLDDAADITSIVDGGTFAFALNTADASKEYLLGITPGIIGGSTDQIYRFDNPTSNLPKLLKLLLGFTIGGANIAIGAQEIVDLLYNLVSSEDFAFKYNSHGFYSQFARKSSSETFRTKTLNANYIGSSFQQFDDFKVNNLFRPLTVAVSTGDELQTPSVKDISRYTVGGDAERDFGDTYLKRPQQEQTKPISAIYGGLKFAFENQYGQLDGIKQVQMRGCVELVSPSSPADKFESSPIFAGDTFINRYTEKTIMPIFSDFLNGQPDQFPYDYLQRVNIPNPRFWMDTRKFDTTALGYEIASFTLASTNDPLPNDLFYLDRGNSSCFGSGTLGSISGALKAKSDPNPVFAMRYAYMYTHVNGVQDFFVESEYNLAYRDWEDAKNKRHYDLFEYTDYDDLFHADIIKDGNFFKYDLSLSPSRFVTQLTPFGNVQPRDYDPTVSETCFQEYPKRLIYSLRAQEEAKKDFWRVFLPNNYKDFRGKVTTIQPVAKTGALIFFPHHSPALFSGVDELQTDLGTKITLGDGGLFAKEPQSIVNSDISNEYGSVESARGVISTPSGLFFISQAQGKIFQYAGKLINIANAGMKWWFNKYLPSTLVRQYPELEDSKLSDNPVIGVGCQSIYDVNDDIVYFTKRDFEVKAQFKNDIIFFNDKFYRNGGFEVEIGDSRFFENTSWTVSYDPKAKAWISFHDWHPELTLPSINHFLTTKTGTSTSPQCPPGYTYSTERQKCERAVHTVVPAVNDVDDIAAIFEGGPEDCLLDIVIAMDVSGSTSLPQDGANRTFGVFETQKKFVREFLNLMAPKMNAQEVQVGFTIWAENQAIYLGSSGNNMSASVTYNDLDDPNDATSFFNLDRIFNPTTVPNGGITEDGFNTTLSGIVGGGTNIVAGYNHAVNNVLNNKGGSELLDRSSAGNLKSILIFITDAQNNNKGNNPSTTASTGYTTAPLGYGLSNDSNYDVYAVYCHPSDPDFRGGTHRGNLYTPDLMDAITNSDRNRQFAILANNAQGYTTSQVAGTISGSVCGAPTSCSCPPGYTLVYPDSNGYYTQSTGSCEDVPICRKVQCDCPSPAPGYPTPVQNGDCPTPENGVLYSLGDPTYVNPTPRTCSYLFTDITLPSFVSGGIWRHNARCDLYTNYYGVDYPWEVEITENTGQNVTTLKSVEYQLESYVYKGDLYNGCADDRWHDLDFNFDETIIYNSEQISGLLKLNLRPKEDPFGMLQYPIINANDIQILYSKEEQKYRFNQFWDITDDRGEFSGIQRSQFITQLNGYIRDLNAVNLNYEKDSLQHKKFRHYYNKVLLRRKVSGDRKMLLKLVNTKLNLSYR